MKTLFLTPKTDNAPKPIPPLGIMYIQAVLDKEGYESKIVDLYDSYNEIKQIIRDYKPDIVGVSCCTDFRQSSFELARIAKEIDPKIKVIMGGPHATFLWEQILRNIIEVDIIVIGEGEFTYLELIKALEKNAPLDKVDGIAFRKSNKPYLTKERKLIQDLDIIPLPSYRDIDIEKYPTMHIQSSRGCSGHCTYCSTGAFWKYWRARSAKNVVDEIEWLVKEKGVKELLFSDDIFTVDKQRVIDICKDIIKRKIILRWNTETRVDSVSLEMLEWMKKAGCYKIQLGVESGSPTILKNIKKNITIEQIKYAFKLCKEVGLETFMFIMVGNQGETWENVKETERLIDEVRPDGLGISIASIYPNTELYNIAKEKGLIDDNFWLSDKKILKYTGENTMNELMKMRLDILKHFFKGRGIFAFTKYILIQAKRNPKAFLNYLSNYSKVFLKIKVSDE